MSKGALGFALGFVGVCFAVAAQQANHSGAAQHRVAAAAVTPLSPLSGLSLFGLKTVSAPNNSLLFRNGPVRTWSDGAQLASETALAQIGMAPLDLFPAAYFVPSEVGAVPTKKTSMASIPRSENLGADGKDLPGEMMGSPLNNVYYTGEIGFLYGQWSGKGGGDYMGSYIWGQAGNDKFQITAGASFDNWDAHGPKFHSFSK